MLESTAGAVYRGLVRGLRTVSPLLGRGDSKLARGVRGRVGAADRLRGWARRHRDPARPLVWFHAPSVGEGLQARAVLARCRDRAPELQTVFTHFSPSAEGLAEAMHVDVADYLPWDISGEMRGVLDALRPDLIAFTKTEVWPVLTAEAGRRGVRTALIAATLPPTSSRLRGPAPWVLRPAFRRLDAVLAIAEPDGRRFARLGAREAVIRVTGDPGIDSAAARSGAANPEAAHLAPFHRAGRPVVVAGSTWPPDEAVLLEAWRDLSGDRPEALLVVAPHEPDASHLEPLEQGLARIGCRSLRLGRIETEGAGALTGEVGAIVVDRVGVLAELYTVGRAAYVGGGFHGDGLHSVLEPAAAGLPVAFGPAHDNARAAAELLEVGGAVEVGGAGDLRAALARWLDDEEARASSGRAAARYIEAHRGAADRTAEHLLALVRREPPVRDRR